MTNILLVALLVGVAYIAWQQTRAKKNDGDTHLRDMLENLRRDLSDTKDKLHDGMGKNAESIQQRLEKTLDLVNKQIGGMDQRIDNRVSDMNKRLDAAAKMMQLIQKQYGAVEEISTSMKQLHEAFKAPKPRGGFGERTLVDLVRQVLPIQSFEEQHTFRSGAIVDLLVRTASGSIPVDAKFPLENYLKLVDSPEDEALRKAFRNDVKKHIRDIAKKYILQEEGTLDFALMYVPSDAVWHEIVSDEEVYDLAQEKHIYIMSPQSCYYFLNVIRLAYQSQQFEENAKKVLAMLRGIQQQSGKLGEDLSVLQKHVGNASAKMGDVQTNYGKLDMQIAQADQLGVGKEAPSIPQEDPVPEMLGV